MEDSEKNGENEEFKSEANEESEEKQIPNLVLGENKQIVEQHKEIPIKVNGEDQVIVIRKLPTGIRNKIRDECSKTSVVGGQRQIKVNEVELQEKILEKAIINAPFDISLESIKSLPVDVSDYIFEEYLEFAEPSPKKKEKSEEQ